MEQLRIVYAGLDILTFLLIVREPLFRLSGVAYNEDFSQGGVNPINYIGRILYLLRKSEKSHILENCICIAWQLLSFASTGIFRKYRRYITALSKNYISIIDFDNPNTSVYLRDNADILVVNAWGMLSGEVVRACRYGAFNVHPSALPRYRGAVPTLWALKNGDKESAVTYMLIDESMDGGPIISQYPFPIATHDNWYSLERTVAAILKKTLVDDIKRYVRGELVPSPQDESLQSKTATYYKYRHIDWVSEKGMDIYNKVNLYPYIEYGLYCYFMENGQKVFIRGAQFVSTRRIRDFWKIHFKTCDGYIISRPFVDLSIRDSVRSWFKKS